MKNPHSILADLASMLLSNLTATATPCSVILSMKVKVIRDSRLSNSFYPIKSQCGSCPPPVPYPPGEVTEMAALPLLIDSFVEGAQLTEDLIKRTRKAELHFLSNVFANMTMVGINLALSPIKIYDPFSHQLEGNIFFRPSRLTWPNQTHWNFL